MKSILDWSMCDSREPGYVEYVRDYDMAIILACLSLPEFDVCWGEEIEDEVDGVKFSQQYLAVGPEFGGKLVSRIWHGQIEQFLKQLCEESPVFARRCPSIKDLGPYALPKEYRKRLLGVAADGSGVTFEGDLTEEQVVRAYLEAGFDPGELALELEHWAHINGLHPDYPVTHAGAVDMAAAETPASVPGIVHAKGCTTTADPATSADDTVYGAQGDAKGAEQKRKRASAPKQTVPKGGRRRAADGGTVKDIEFKRKVKPLIEKGLSDALIAHELNAKKADYEPDTTDTQVRAARAWWERNPDYDRPKSVQNSLPTKRPSRRA